MRITDFDVLTFDCYGTLIDWESGIHAALQPLLARIGRPVPREEVLETFARHEAEQEAQTPAMPYSELLAVVHACLARHWGVAPEAEEDARFGANVPEWPAFADSAPSLQYLEKHYKLVVLSNVDRASFRGSNAKLGVTFDAIYTAQDIGSYKPDPRNFAYMLARLGEKGVAPNQILHTAQSLFHDHVPAKAAGLATAWIDPPARGAGLGRHVAAPQGGADRLPLHQHGRHGAGPPGSAARQGLISGLPIFFTFPVSDLNRIEPQSFGRPPGEIAPPSWQTIRADAAGPSRLLRDAGSSSARAV